MPKGHTNNRLGRPPGLGVVAKLRREMLGEGKVTQLVNKVYELAIAGDMVAARLLLDRVLPSLRTQAALVNVPLNPADTLTAKATALLHAVANGEVASDIAAEMIRSLGGICAIEQGDELRKRLDALEFGDLA